MTPDKPSKPCDPAGPIAYLVSQYPAFSHTFVRREVRALRDENVQVETFSIRAGPPALRADPSWEGDRRTFVVLDQGFGRFIGSALAALARPLALLSTFRLALRHRPPGARGLGRAIIYFGESLVLASEFRRRGVRRVHNHFANSAAIVGLLAGHFLNIPWSFVIHGPSETDYPAGLLLGDKIRQADLVVCAHRFGASQGMRLVADREWGKFRVVRCGIAFDDLPEQVPDDHRDDGIICVGRLTGDKGQAGLLRAFAQLRHARPTTRLMFVGSGPDQPRLESLARELGIDQHVDFRGALPETETLAAIARSRLLVLPSFWEGLPVVLMEAMALRVPVVTSRIAGVPELIEHNESGLLFTATDWDDLAIQIDRLLVDRDLWATLARNGLERVQEGFDVRGSATLLRELFDSPPTTRAGTR